MHQYSRNSNIQTDIYVFWVVSLSLFIRSLKQGLLIRFTELGRHVLKDVDFV